MLGELLSFTLGQSVSDCLKDIRHSEKQLPNLTSVTVDAGANLGNSDFSHRLTSQKIGFHQKYNILTLPLKYVIL
jgi:hypothetical protein